MIERMTQTANAIEPDMTMEQVLATYPGAQRALFARYHIGGCQSCAFRPEETLAELCQRNDGLAVTEVIDHLQESRKTDAEQAIEPVELKTRLDAGDDIRLLDVRIREEHESVKIEGSRLFTQEVLQEIFGSWSQDTTIVIYDHEGVRACMDAAAYLKGHGFKQVFFVRGGIDAYSREADSSIPRYRVEIDD